MVIRTGVGMQEPEEPETTGLLRVTHVRLDPLQGRRRCGVCPKPAYILVGIAAKAEFYLCSNHAHELRRLL